MHPSHYPKRGLVNAAKVLSLPPWVNLTHACDRRLLTRTGTGSKSDQFRYHLHANQPAA